MLEPQEYAISYRTEDGSSVERFYQHHGETELEPNLVLTPDHGWLYDPITITEISSHPDEGAPGSARAELYQPPAHVETEEPPSTPVESL
jgi:hypothetical protein